jgi:hypothetical protein
VPRFRAKKRAAARRNRYTLLALAATVETSLAEFLAIQANFADYSGYADRTGCARVCAPHEIRARSIAHFPHDDCESQTFESNRLATDAVGRADRTIAFGGCDRERSVARISDGHSCSVAIDCRRSRR